MYAGTFDSLPHENDPAVNVDELWRRTYGLAHEYVIENEPPIVLERIQTARSALQKTALLTAMLQNGVLAEQDETWQSQRGQVIALIAQLLAELDLLVVFGNRPVLTAFYSLLEGYIKTSQDPGTLLVEISGAVVCATYGDRPAQTAQGRRVRGVLHARHVADEHGPLPGSTQTVPDPVQAAGVQNTAGHPEPCRSVHGQPGACRAEEGRQPAKIRRLCEPRVLPADSELPDLSANQFFPDGGQAGQGDARAGAAGVSRP